ncbi:MAG: sigma 54-interacting transcriptional regulator [Deltaproteobacteria bacterium]|nr:sigma 54-interacting transcriptional regulator [Deltaproteobacteria bacterium]
MTAHDDPSTDSAPRLRVSSRSLAAGHWQLHVVVAPDGSVTHKPHPLPAGATVVGRQPVGRHVLEIDDTSLSRSHVQIECKAGPDAVVVRDLDSRNGVYLSGRPCDGDRAGQGAVLRFGRCVAVLEFARGEARPTLDGLHREIPGASAVAQALRADLRYAATTAHPVLIEGPTGSGKEFAAGALHRLSGRKGAIVRVNVSAIPETLLESTLFGHERGAFTGARDAAKGLIREADGGTLVLDEVGELPATLQPKLLRAVEEGTVRPIGGSRDLPVQVRIVACTNARLDRLVETGRFRRDLAARLRGHHICIAGMADRKPDILALADAVLPVPADLPVRGASQWRQVLEPEVAEALLLHPWTDGMRELRGVLVHLLRDAPLLDDDEPKFTLASLPPAMEAWALGLFGGPDGRSRAKLEPQAAIDRPRPGRGDLLGLIGQHGGNIEAIARELGVHRRQVYRWLAMAGIDRVALKQLRAGQ